MNPNPYPLGWFNTNECQKWHVWVQCWYPPITWPNVNSTLQSLHPWVPWREVGDWQRHSIASRCPEGGHRMSSASPATPKKWPLKGFSTMGCNGNPRTLGHPREVGAQVVCPKIKDPEDRSENLNKPLQTKPGVWEALLKRARHQPSCTVMLQVSAGTMECSTDISCHPHLVIFSNGFGLSDSQKHPDNIWDKYHPFKTSGVSHTQSAQDAGRDSRDLQSMMGPHFQHGLVSKVYDGKQV